MHTIYLDYNATTPIDGEVADAIFPFLTKHFGNPSSGHIFSTAAKEAIFSARKAVSASINCSPEEIVFTSGGTESNNHALKGAAYALKKRGTHIIISSVEHPAIIEVCRFLETQGYTVTIIPVDSFGMVDPGVVEENIRPDTILISVMQANNEVGTIQPISQIGEIAKNHGILMHTDAAQSLGKIPVDVEELNVDLLSIAGHKIYAPKGVGALYIREGTPLTNFMHGAGQESGRRAGTENVILIAGLGKACEIIQRDFNDITAHYRRMRDMLFQKLSEALPDMRLNGHPENRLPNTLSVGIPGIAANKLLDRLDTVAASAGSACHSDSVEISPVLQAMNTPLEQAIGTIRLSTGRSTTEDEIEEAVQLIKKAYRELTE